MNTTRILSACIAIVLTLCFGLTSCGHEHVWDSGKITQEASASTDGVKTFTCTECGETKTTAIKYNSNQTSTKVTTVANAEEWKQLFVLTNCTALGHADREESVVTITVADNQCIIITNGPSYSSTYYLFEKNGTWYEGSATARGYTSTEKPKMTGIMLGDAFESFEKYADEYSEFIYDESQKAYVKQWTHASGTVRTCTVYVENGKLAKISYRNGNYSSDELIFSNYGTTVIDSFPEFCTEHTYEETMSFDDDFHWYGCTTEGCGNTQGMYFHDLSETGCTECGYKKDN